MILLWLMGCICTLILIALGAAFVLSCIVSAFGILVAIVSGAWISILFGKRHS